MKFGALSILFVFVLVGGWGLGRGVSKQEATVVGETVVGKMSPSVAGFSGGVGERLDGFRELDAEGRMALFERWLGERPELIYLALADWAREDPLAALEAVDSLPRPKQRVSRGAILGEWMRSEPADATAFLEALDRDALRSRVWWDAFRSAGEELAQLDPVAAVKLCMRPIDASVGKPWGTLDVVYDQWAKNDRDALLAWANEIDGMAPRSMAIGALGKQLGTLGREGLAWLDSKEFSEYDRELAEERMALSWVKADPKGVEEELLAGDFKERARLESDLISELLISRADEMRFEDVRELFGRCEFGADLLPELGDLVSRDELLELVGLAEYADSWPALDLVWDLGDELAEKNPASMVEWLRGIRSDGLRADVGPKMMQTLEEEVGKDGAFEYLKSFDGAEDVSWVAEAFGVMSVGAPRVWVEKLEEVPAPARDAAQLEVVKIWAEAEPRGVVDYLADANLEIQPAVKLHGELARRWVRGNAGAVGDWADQLEPGDARDAVVVALINELVEESPDAAQQWASSLSDEAERSRQEERVRVLLDGVR